VSKVRIEHPRLRLAAQLGEAGGLTVAEAVQKANANLAEIAPQCLTELQRAAQAAEAAFRALPPAFAAEPLQGLYAIASRAVGLGAVGGAPGADVALVSLCDLVDRMAASGRWNLAAIGVHVQTLQALAFGAAGDARTTARVLAGLKLVSEHYADAPAPAARAATA
jgi:hypothetical protein